MTSTIEQTSAPIDPVPTPRRPRWAFPALTLLLFGTSVGYLIDLSSQKWGNAFYAAAVQAGSVSWKAFLFGSSDAANSITVDKPPASLWIMEISVRVFGLNSWSVLAPQVLLGVLSVAILNATVARKFGYGAGLIAGSVLALTPTAALMFRYDNPDALLTLLMVCAAWAMVHALDTGRTRWLVATGIFIGFGFIAKQLEVFLPLPGIALAYLLFGPPKFWTRIVQLLAAGLAVVVSAGWWVAIVVLTPAADRPWVGGSSTNSILDLTFGYNGIGRLTGNERPAEPDVATASGAADAANAGGYGGGGFGGRTGITRLFADAQGGQIAWLIPAALILLVVGIAARKKAPRTDFRRAWYTMWGVWLVGAALVFSFMSGTFHAYYTITLAPAVAAIIAPSVVELWRGREKRWIRAVLAVTLLATLVTAFAFTSRTPDFLPWLRWTVLVAGILAILGIVLAPPAPERVASTIAVIACLVSLAGPTAYVIDTIGSSHSGGGVSAGPAIAGAQGEGRGGIEPNSSGSNAGNGSDAGGQDGQQAARRMGGFAASEPSAQLQGLLEQDSSNYTWVAATVGSNSAAGYQLATGDPVMPIGGFSGSDPSPTLEQFQQYVHDDRIHYFIAPPQNGDGRGRTSDIATWVQQNYSPTTIDDVTVYDLTASAV